MTRFSINMFDSLFGEKMELEVPTQDGGIVKRKVTKRWFEEMLRQRKIEEVESAGIPNSVRQRFDRSRLQGEGDQAPKSIELESRAQLLVRAAMINALALSTPNESALLKKYPFLEEPILQDGARWWDILAIAAGITCGQLALADWARSGNVTQDVFTKLTDLILKSFTTPKTHAQDANEADPDVLAVLLENVTVQQRIALLQDCGQFIGNALTNAPSEEELDHTILASAGVWVLWNLYGRQPTTEEAEAATAIGYLLGAECLLWWDESQWPGLSQLRPRVRS